MSDNDNYEIPLQDQRVFGAGIKRKRVQFVPASTLVSAPAPSSATPAKSVSDLYLKLVLPRDLQASDDTIDPAISTQAALANTREEACSDKTCEICSLPLEEHQDTDELFEGGQTFSGHKASKIRPHEASLAHQICLEHSHPPSHLDRNRKGLAYLSSYGWNPDSRLGLGASGQGIQYPIKTKPKDDKLGIGVALPKPGELLKKKKPMKLDAGKVRKLHEKDRQKAEKLRELFYRNDDVERYLGGG